MNTKGNASFHRFGEKCGSLALRRAALTILASVIALWPARIAAQSQVAAGPLAGPSRAILSRGTRAARGLPFFSPNAIPALWADYLLVPAGSVPGDAATAVGPGHAEPSIRVWCTREAVVLGTVWTRTALGDHRAFILKRQDGPVLALIAARYTLFFELPAAPAGASSGTALDLRRGAEAEVVSFLGNFALAFERRFSLFFDHAPSDAELSFPAYFDVPR